MTNSVQDPDPVVLSHEQIVEMYLVVIKMAADQDLKRKRHTNHSLSVSPEVLKQLMDLQSKKKCEYCRSCGCCGRSDRVMAVATHDINRAINRKL